ncbi:MAG: thioredoxin domain-containing protein, partial [Acidobacteria bacterium]|nr:thioredoxin domain-containing protein [Acidobacteriota bacterium]
MPNRLAQEKSPYLLQHAGNPVDWYPWGDEAFARARQEDKPIFLSIGYSTCHWCHVMEHESFEHPGIAALLNAGYVSIKVDREERPDVDRVYMLFVQATTGSGGWPMSVWLTPDLKPFHGGTYFPPDARYGRPGFGEVLAKISRAWQENRSSIEQSADQIVGRLRGFTSSSPVKAIPGVEALDAAVRDFEAAFDARRGGFGGAPKFPRPTELLFLFREFARTGSEPARDMALRTLQAMALGGMRDHIGGGFHRYAVDAGWRVPHFEKMLYDQAQLVLACLEAAQVTGEPVYADVADDTLRYVARDMTDSAGGFYSAEDADSLPPEHAGQAGAHKSEGAFYLWRDDDVGALLAEAAPLVRQRFGVLADGNAPFDPQGEFTGKNLLYVAASFEEIASSTCRPVGDVAAILEQARATMRQAREQRPRPHLDDKILTAWNGLMIAAFARGARVIGRVDHLASAQRAAEAVRRRMWNPETRTLLRRFRDGDAAIPGYAEDYAYLVWGLLELFQADGNADWLEWAIELQRRQDELFFDEASGGWFSTTGDDPSVLVRMKEDYDGAEPSATSVAVANLIILAHLTQDASFQDRIERTLGGAAVRLVGAGRSVPLMLANLSAYHAGAQQVVIVGSRE